MPDILMLRADASADVGAGHVMRSLALAHAWINDGGKAVLVSRSLTAGLGHRLVEDGIAVVRIEDEIGCLSDVDATLAVGREIRAKVIALDGYRFCGDFQRKLRDLCPVMVLDDFGQIGGWHCDWILDQNLGARAEIYTSATGQPKRLLGTKYALLRSEFIASLYGERNVPEIARKIIVSFGGSNTGPLIEKTIEAIRRLDIDELQVIVVTSEADRLWTQNLCPSGSAPRIEVQSNVRDMPRLLAWADLAIGAAGSSSWERALLGLPSLIFVLAENQRQVAESCEQVGICRNLGWHSDVDVETLASSITELATNAELRQSMARAGQACVDGEGAQRVVMALRGESIRLRPAIARDKRVFWEISNQPTVRAASFQSQPIPWEDHERWFASRLENSSSRLLLAMDEHDQPVGQSRLDWSGSEAVISVGVSESSRGQGFGAQIVQATARRAFASPNCKRVLAYIKPANLASAKTFLKAGFVRERKLTFAGQSAELYVLSNLEA